MLPAGYYRVTDRFREKEIRMKGYVQVYTGNGKGKTTAAFGLALRAAGAGLKVYIAQFVKGMDYSEHTALKRFSDLVTITQYGRDCFIRNAPTEEDIIAARKGLAEVQKVLSSGQWDVVILDEANIAAFYGLFSPDELVGLIDAKPEALELVITGRNAHQKVLDKADLITEMKEVRHYYAKGVKARKGIEM